MMARVRPPRYGPTLRQRKIESKSPAPAFTAPKRKTTRTATDFSISALRISAFPTKCFFVHDVRHFRWIAAVVSLEHVDHRLRGSSGHSFIRIDIQPRNLGAAGKMMKHTATI